MEKLKLNRSAIRYLLLQRSKFHHPIRKFFGRARIGGIYDKYLMNFVERIQFEKRSDEIGRLYLDHLKNQFHIMQPYLPKNVENILDVGCGLGGINILLDEYYNRQHTRFFLLDKNEMTKNLYYAFEDQAAAYNSLDVTTDFLEDNGVNKFKLITVDIANQQFPTTVKFDLVISLASWGFHYPVETYLEEVTKCLTQDGCLFLDLRNQTDGMAKIKENIEFVEEIEKTEKFTKIIAKKGNSDSGSETDP